jgi:hypothetical protein
MRRNRHREDQIIAILKVTIRQRPRPVKWYDPNTFDELPIQYFLGNRECRRNFRAMRSVRRRCSVAFASTVAAMDALACRINSCLIDWVATYFHHHCIYSLRRFWALSPKGTN